MKVLIVKTDHFPIEADIPNTNEAMQEIVGGYYRPLELEPGVVLICNEDAKLAGLKFNRCVRDGDGNILQPIHGSFFICGKKHNSLTSLPLDKMGKYKREFWQTEIIVEHGDFSVPVKANELIPFLKSMSDKDKKARQKEPDTHDEPSRGRE